MFTFTFPIFVCALLAFVFAVFAVVCAAFAVVFAVFAVLLTVWMSLFATFMSFISPLLLSPICVIAVLVCFITVPFAGLFIVPVPFSPLYIVVCSVSMCPFAVVMPVSTLSTVSNSEPSSGLDSVPFP